MEECAACPATDVSGPSSDCVEGVCKSKDLQLIEAIEVKYTNLLPGNGGDRETGTGLVPFTRSSSGSSGTRPSNQGENCTAVFDPDGGVCAPSNVCGAPKVGCRPPYGCNGDDSGSDCLDLMALNDDDVVEVFAAQCAWCALNNATFGYLPACPAVQSECPVPRSARAFVR